MKKTNPLVIAILLLASANLYECDRNIMAVATAVPVVWWIIEWIIADFKSMQIPRSPK